MNIRYSLTLLAAGLTLWGNAQNTCNDAQAITVGMYTVGAVDGPDLPLPVCSSGGTGATAGEWYRYTATANVVVTVSTDLAQNVDVDTRVQVYSGTCGDLTCVTGDDDSGSGVLSLATFNAFAGESFLIAFDNRYSSLGFDFSLGEQPWNPNLISFSNVGISTTGNTWGVVDMNNDGLDDVIGVSASNVRINHQQEVGGFVATDLVTPTTQYPAGWSLAIGDVDGNGYMDLLYGNTYGATFMFSNDQGTGYSMLESSDIFCQRTNFVDINNDGHLDAFVCHDVQPNVYFLNDGNGDLQRYQGGLGDVPDGGNYGSIWIDYDNDGDPDLFLSKCRGGNSPANINEMHRNNGDGTFTEVGAEAGLMDNILTWSSAWGDFDNDGHMDVLVGASSSANGMHKLMRNNGDGTFSSVTAGSGYDIFTPMGIEHVAHDFNNDGYIDVMGAGSTIMFNNGDFTFSPHSVSAGSGPIGDLNNDGFLDVVNGGTIRMNNGNNNNWIKVRLQGVTSNLNGIGARVEVTSSMGTQMRHILGGDGFRYMSSLTAHFGLGQDEVIEQLTIYWPSGVVDILEDVAVNGSLVITESLITAVNEADPAMPVEAIGYPNPTQGMLFIRGLEETRDRSVRVMDASGRLVLTTQVLDGRLDLSSLTSGSYSVQLFSGDRPVVLRINRQ